MVTKMICASCRRYLLGHQEKTLPSVIPKVMLNWFLPKSQKTGNVLVHVSRILTLASQWRELSMSLAPPPPPPPPPRIQKSRRLSSLSTITQDLGFLSVGLTATGSS